MYTEVFIKVGSPIAGWFITENPVYKRMIWEYPVSGRLYLMFEIQIRALFLGDVADPASFC